MHGQGQKREQKPTTKKVHNHSPLLTMVVISAVLGRNSQNKPNGFSTHVVLRSRAEISVVADVTL